MDHFSIPERLEPVAPTEDTRRQSFTSDQRRRRSQKPTPEQPSDENSDPPEESDTSHNVDEIA
jgi:hypothetical protein